jgi:2-methylisocitrate lyase-like PEP mutase family enzyme
LACRRIVASVKIKWKQGTVHDHADKAASFLSLHRRERPLLLANAWDAGSAKLLASLGFEALATDWSGAEGRLYDAQEAAERVAAASEAAHAGPVQLVLTARAENYLRGKPDLGDTIARLHAYQAAGADVLYAPGLNRAEDIRELVASVKLPVNVLARPGVPPVPELAALGVKRISVGGALAYAALGAAASAATELLTGGTYDFLGLSAVGAKAARAAFTD